MHRVLFVAEGTFDRPLRNVVSIFVGMTILLAGGFLIVGTDMPLPLTVATLAALLLGTAWMQVRFGGQRQFRLEKRRDGEPLRLTGRFQEGRVGTDGPAELAATELTDGGLRFITASDQGADHFHLKPPAFSTESLKLLRDTIHELQTLSLTEIHSTYSGRNGPIRFYDTRNLVLLRFQQKPSYVAILAMVAGLTVLLWFVVGRLLLP